MINGVPQTVPAPADVAVPPPGAQQTSSGLFTVVLQSATNTQKPTPADRVKVLYSAWTKEGVLFDSTKFKDEAVVLDVNRGLPIAGWKEAVQMMSPGERRRFWIPANLAYGSQPTEPSNPPGQLTFDIELVEIDHVPVAPAAPPDIAAAPKEAIHTPSGLAYRVLEKGDGTLHPSGPDMVDVVFTGWTANGTVFDSSIPTRQAKRYFIERLIPGWAEALGGMVQGERRLLWIPARLAHGHAIPGDTSKKPRGDLVVDVKLVGISSRGPEQVR
jgi:peptidylprolyl isomerase